ncbi:sugar ABC transporter substrate-binding protein [Actinomyces polynesiensis]|uniref:sugar ABC transporter substrate-binding protein n=1 Tax=Actinomyces polynesiensis TaxID=1325934 RepID=UPI0005B7D69B|nr:extracellular solute-binding protein [Actinomyces polynesiensis]
MRRGIAALGALALVGTLAACGGEADQSGDAASGAAGDQSGAAGVGTLTIWADDTRYGEMQEFAKDFTAETQIELSVVQKSESDMDQEFITQVPTGKGPDLIVMAHDKLGALVTNGVVGTVDLSDVQDEFSDSAVQAVAYDGQTYGVPYAIESVALVRNNALTTDTPTTFDDMISSGEATGVKYPFIIQMGDEGDPYHFYPFQTSFGAPVFEQSADGSYTTDLALGGENGTAFAEWLKAQGDAGILDPAITSDVAKQAFLDGEAPYTVTGPWNVTAFREAGMDVSVLPVPKAGDQDAQPFVGVQVFFPSAKTENQLLVNKFLEYVETAAAQQQLYEIGGRVPAMTSVAEGIDDEDIKGFATVAGAGVPMPAIPEMGSVWQFWGVTEANIVTGKEAPEEGWSTMVENIKGAISK